MEIRDAFVIALDETPKEGSLAAHDKAYHPHGYHKGDECKFRDKLAQELEGDDVGLEDANAPKEKGEQQKPLVTPEEDAAYMEAVEKGDMETAAKMIHGVAQNAGFSLEAFHGTELGYFNGGKPFTVFEEASHFGTKEVAEGVAKSKAEQTGGKKPYVYSVLLKIKKPKRVQDVPKNWDNTHSEYWWEQMHKAENEGYDGLVYSNGYEDKSEHNDSYMPLYPSQIKSADPVTYDDNGKVIPLSRRFDDGDDIRGDVTPRPDGEHSSQTTKEQTADTTAEQQQEQQSQTKTEPRTAKDLSEDLRLASRRLRDLGYTEMVDTAEQRLRDIIGGDGYEGREYERAVAAAVAKKLLEPEKDNFPFIYRELDTLDAYGVSDSDIRSAARTLSDFFFGIQDDWEIRLEDIFEGKTPPDGEVMRVIGKYLKQEHPVRQKIAQMHEDYEREQTAKRERDAMLKRTAYPEQKMVDNRLAELVSTKPANYTPNPTMTAEEIRKITGEHRAYWDKVVSTGTDMGTTEGREFITQRLFDTLGAADSHGADETLVGELMPDVQMSDDVGLSKGSFNPYTSNTNIAAGDNCWKGVLAGLMRMRGFNVEARKAAEPSPIFADSGNEQVAEGKQISVYLHSMQKMTESYEHISGSAGEVENKFAQMAQGDAENGIAPYPDGTFVMTWDGHARGNYLYKGKWFSFDPFGFDDFRTQKEGIEDAPYIKPVSTETLSFLADSGSREEEENEIGEVVNQLIQERLFTGNGTYMFPPDDRRRQVILALMHEGREDGLYLTGKGIHSGPPDRNVLNRVIKRLVQKGTLRKFSSSIVIRPQDPLIKDILGLVKAGRSRNA